MGRTNPGILLKSDRMHPQAHDKQHPTDEHPPFTYVDTPETLAPALEAVRAAPRLAVDIEANGLYSYFHKVCLLQFSTAETNFILDPFAPLDLEPLLEALADTPMVLHAGDYDLRMMRKSYGFRPNRPVFDTMLAAQLLGHEFLGLPKILEAHTGIQTTKSGQKSDWTRRPLSPKQLAYAVDDTCHLLRLADVLHAELDTRGRVPWHEESCARMVDGTEEEREPDPESVWRIKGWTDLGRRELAFLRTLWEWRESEAQRVDKPTFKIISNPQLIHLAEAGARSAKGDGLRGVQLPRSIRGARLDNLRAALKRAAALPSSEYPPQRLARGAPRPKESPYLPKVLQAVAKKAKELEMAPQVIASRATLLAIALATPADRDGFMEAGGLMNWQADLLVPILSPVFAEPPPEE